MGRFQMNSTLNKEMLQKIDYFANSLSYSKALGSDEEFIRLLENVISASKGSGLYLRDIEEFVEKSKEIPHYAVRRAAWILSKHTKMRFIGMEVIPQKSRESIWPSPLLGILKQYGYQYGETDKLTLKGFYSDYKASIGTSKIDLIYQDVEKGKKVIRLIEVKSYGQNSGEFKLKKDFSTKELEEYIKKSDKLYPQLVFVGTLPTLISLKESKLCSYYYLKPEDSGKHRFFEILRNTSDIDDLLKNKKQISLKEDETLSFEQNIDYQSLKYSGNLSQIYETIPLCEGTRMIWVLMYLFNLQRESNELVIIRRKELSKIIEERLKTIMTSDIQRHDFEDQLERKGYIGRKGTEKDVCYFITPSGLFRGYYYLSKIDAASDFSERDFTKLMNSQAKRISKDLGWT